jgi:predicted transcriptional regulator
MDMAHASESNTVGYSTSRLILGPLEFQVMEVLWVHGECTVREVAIRLDRSLAYTTVMTTLDRLFRKDVIRRRKFKRAYFYSACVSRQEWGARVARDVVAKLLAGPQTSREVLAACLMDAVAQHKARPLRTARKQTRNNL